MVKTMPSSWFGYTVNQHNAPQVKGLYEGIELGSHLDRTDRPSTATL